VQCSIVPVPPRALWPALLIAVTAADAVLAATNADWPEFRGPTGQGTSTARHLPIEWSSGDSGAARNIAWKTPLPGEGWSSPVLVGGRLYVTAAVPNASGAQLSLRALCLDAATGRALWNTEVFPLVPSGRKHEKNSHASPTPVVEGGRLFVHFGHQGTACLDLAGRVLWRNQSLKYSPVHGSGGSPIVVDDKLIFSCDGASEPFVVALHKLTGQIAWKAPRRTQAQRKFSFSTPLAITVGGQRQVISPGSGAVCAYDPRDGRELWRARYGEGYSVVPRPVFGHGLVFVSSGFDRPEVLAIRPDGKGDETGTHVAWKLARSAPKTPSLLLAGDELYLVSDDGIASGVDARTGQVHWQERVEGAYSASPVFADGRIYLQSEDGTGVVLKAGKTFAVLARNPLGERSLASYAVTDGALFIRTAGHLFCVKEGAGAR
jgi:outer membrane protein assembly factor BamB